MTSDVLQLQNTFKKAGSEFGPTGSTDTLGSNATASPLVGVDGVVLSTPCIASSLAAEFTVKGSRPAPGTPSARFGARLCGTALVMCRRGLAPPLVQDLAAAGRQVVEHLWIVGLPFLASFAASHAHEP